MPEKRICPKCGNVYAGFPAISREDNKTEICPTCGVKEAFGDYEKYYKTYMETGED